MRVLCEVVLLFVLAFCQEQIYFPTTDEICKSKRGEKLCVHVSKCSNRTRIYQLDDYPKPCGLQGKHPFVCCESADIVPRPGTKTTNECQKYFEMIPIGRDGHPDYSTAKGYKLNFIENFPFMAALGIQVNGTFQWVCTGALISNKFILTAASCLHNKLPNATINLIRLGDLKLNSKSDNVELQSFGVSRIIIHPAFSPPALYNDIALIEMDKAVRITNYVKPACMQTTRSINEYIWAVLGYQSSKKEYEDELSIVAAWPSKRETCLYYFNKLGLFNDTLPQGVNQNIQMCSRPATGESDCLKDIGAPLSYINLSYKEGQWLIGITSIPTPCNLDHIPGLYTRISYYIPWIEAHVWP